MEAGLFPGLGQFLSRPRAQGRGNGRKFRDNVGAGLRPTLPTDNTLPHHPHGSPFIGLPARVIYKEPSILTNRRLALCCSFKVKR